MEYPRVVITGIGPVSSIGIGKKQYNESLFTGKSGITPLEKTPVFEKYDTEEKKLEPPIKYAGQIKNFNLENYGFTPKEIKRLDKTSHFPLVATKLALDDSNLTITKENAKNLPVHPGIGLMGTETYETQIINLKNNGYRKISSYAIPKSMPNGPASNIIHYIKNSSSEIKDTDTTMGEAITINSACASSLSAIISAIRTIKCNETKIAITGGTEAAITPISIGTFNIIRALSQKGISRPYDKERDGFVIGEGSGIIILEELEHAKKRDAKIYAEIIGYGTTSDAHHITAPHKEGKGLIEAINQAIQMANIPTEKIKYANLHGTSTQLNDIQDAQVIKYLFPNKQPYCNSTKSLIGHTIGAAGTLELIATLLQIENNFIHPTLNYKTPDPECNININPETIKNVQIEYALKTNCGFGGANNALILKKYTE